MSYNNDNKTISTERLLLRLLTTSDAAAVTALCNNYNIYKSTLTLPYPYVVEDALPWIEHHLSNFNADISYEFAVTDKLSGELYGAIALTNNQEFRRGELAYFIGEPFWGRGYATEAAQAVLHFAFDVKQYHKVFARYFRSNPASGSVMRKIGMTQEGILKRHVRKDDHYEDLVYCGIIQPEAE